MRTILLTRSKRALVDDEVYDWLHAYNWSVLESQRGTGIMYARRRSRGQLVYLHRQILGVPGFAYVGTRDSDGLNCQRANLYALDSKGEVVQWRAGVGRSCWIGVEWDPLSGLWRAVLAGLEVGVYAAEADAARAYNAKLVQLYGEQAAVNDIPFLGRSLATSFPDHAELQRKNGPTGRGYSETETGEFQVDLTISGRRYRRKANTAEAAEAKVRSICLMADAAERVIG
jgi:hypothetical protein